MAPALLRRRRRRSRRKYDLVNRYGLRGAGIWALGYDGHATGAVPGARRASSSTTRHAPTAGILTLGWHASATPGFVGRLDRHATTSGIASYDVQVSIDGGAVGGVADGHDDGLGRLPRASRPRLRVPRPGARPQGQRRCLGRHARRGRRRRRSASGGFGRVRTDGLAMRRRPRAPRRRGSGTLDGGAHRRDHRPARSAPTATPGSQVSRPLREWGAVTPVTAGVWVAAGSATATLLVGRPGPEQHERRRRSSRGLGFDGADDGRSGRPRRRSPPRLLARTATARATTSPSLDEPVALDTLSLNVYRADGTLAGTSRSVSVARRPAALRLGRPGRWRGASGRPLPAHARRRRLRARRTPTPSHRSVPSARRHLRRHDRHRRPDDHVRVDQRLAACSPNGDGLHDTVRIAIGATGANGWTCHRQSADRLDARRRRSATRSGSGDAATGRLGRPRRTADTCAPTAPTGCRCAATTPPATRDPARGTSVSTRATDRRARPPRRPLLARTATARPTRAALAWTATSRSAAPPGSSAARPCSGPGRSRPRGGRRDLGRGPTRTVDGSPTGAVLFRVTVRDAAGNTSSRAIVVVVDRTLSALGLGARAVLPAGRRRARRRLDGVVQPVRARPR